MLRYLSLILIVLLTGCLPTTTIEAEEIKMSDSVPVVRILAANGWAQGGQLTPGANNPLNAMAVGGLPAGNYTIQFNVSDPNTSVNLTPGDIIRARATITWKVNGNPVIRVVDVGNGVSVTGVAEAIDVQLQDVSSTSAGTPILLRGRPYTVTITCAPGTRPSVEQPPTVALPQTNLAAGATKNFDVPIGAISVFVAVFPAVVGSPIGAYQIQVNQLAINTSLKLYDPRQTDWVPLIPGTTQIGIAADAALPTDTEIQVTFGIDG